MPLRPIRQHSTGTRKLNKSEKPRVARVSISERIALISLIDLAMHSLRGRQSCGERLARGVITALLHVAPYRPDCHPWRLISLQRVAVRGNKRKARQG